VTGSGLCPIVQKAGISDTIIWSVVSMSLSWTSPQSEDVATTKPIGTGEARVSERIPICCPVNLSHENESDQSRSIIRGRVLNMSASGVLVEARRPIAVGSQVRIQANELLTGTALVRRSTGRLWRFRIGLEFTQPVQSRY
jgi:hypothetical protein